MSRMFDGYFPSPQRTNDESGVPDLNQAPPGFVDYGVGAALPNLNQEYFVHDHPDWHLTPSSSLYLAQPEHDYGQPSYHFSGDPHYIAQPSYHFNTEELYSCSQCSYPLVVGDAYRSQPEPDHILETPHETVDEDYDRNNSDDDGDNYIREAWVSYKTDILFSSREELEEWAKKRGREHGCVVVVQRSRPKAVDLGCNRGGEPKLNATIRRTGSIKKGCPFKLKGRHNHVGNFWKLEVVNETHNHDPFVFKEGHAYLRIMTDDMVNMVASLHADSLKTSKIAPLLRRRFPGACVIDKDIHNLIEKWRKENTVGDTPMQKSFCIAHVVLLRERQTDFTWALEHLKGMLEDSIEPRVIVTDRDSALMNSCKKIFPNAIKNLCRWHIHENIKKKWKGIYDSKAREDFALLWSVLCESPTFDDYEYNCLKFQEMLCKIGKEKVWDYIHHSWLLRDNEKFVSCWMADRLNFGETTTNRVESQHANLKRHLNGANNTLHALSAYALELIEAQKALTLLHKEYGKLEKMTESGHSCRHQLRTSMRLPCACELERHLNTCVPIPLKSIGPLWRKLDLDPVVAQVEEEDFEAEMEELNQTVLIHKDRKQKRSLLSKIWSVLPGNSNKKEPEKWVDPRGRPNLNQETKKVEAARHSSYIPSSYPTSSSQNTDQTPSFLERSRSQSHSQLKMPPPKPSKRSSKKKENGAALGFPLVVYPEYVATVNWYKGFVPRWSYPYISRIIDVKPDGNCGFRAIAEGLGIGKIVGGRLGLP
ncbi:uncharacterized protein LOC143586918 [Bidens hawaiensis]|uniref:uncharacterized protein LOC143586918 n=1 Tax=Bidens hawaiensis TaxID=980011 RepID=UPI0040495A76